jgi:plasmid stabilization system protein ParE
MAQVNRTRRANADLDEIWLHVALDNPVAADRLVDRIVSDVEIWLSIPGLDKPVPKLRRVPGY